MAFFPRACLAETQSTPFAPFFRLLEDLDIHNRPSIRPSTPTRQLVSPKFDVKELPDAYQLYGEFPGLDQNNITLEFTDLNTLTVRAHNERHYETNAPTTEGGKDSEAVTEQSQHTSEQTDNAATTQASQKATVEDAEDDGFVVTEKQTPSETSNTTTEPIHTPASTQVASPSQPEVTTQPQHRYHAYERTVGNFYRQFNFPRHVDQEAVTASMKNGILSIVVPKKRLETRKIAIN